MKILQSTAMADSRGGGVAEVVFSIAPALASRGHRVTLMGRVDSAQAASVAARVPSLVTVEKGREAAAALLRIGPAVMHSHGLWDPLLNAALSAARGRRVPTVIAPHGMLDSWALAQGRIKKRLALATYEGRNLRRAACIHALTEAERIAVKALAPEVPVAVIPNGVTLPEIVPAHEVEEGEKMLLFLGRIHPKKGIVELVEAFAALANTPDALRWRVEIAGWDDGGHRREVENAVKRYKLGTRVRFVGPVFGTDKDRLIASATAFALPSYSEGLPMAVLEAWAQARPVLMTPECNLPEAETAGAAVMCATGVDGVRAGLTRLFAMSPAKRAEIGRAGLGLVATRFDWNRVAEDLEMLYGWVRGNGECPGFVA